MSPRRLDACVDRLRWVVTSAWCIIIEVSGGEVCRNKKKVSRQSYLVGQLRKPHATSDLGAWLPCHLIQQLGRVRQYLIRCFQWTGVVSASSRGSAVEAARLSCTPLVIRLLFIHLALSTT